VAEIFPTLSGLGTEILAPPGKIAESPLAKATGVEGLNSYQLVSVVFQVPEAPPFHVRFFAETFVLVTVPLKMMSGLALLTIRKVPIVLVAPKQTKRKVMVCPPLMTTGEFAQASLREVREEGTAELVEMATEFVPDKVELINPFVLKKRPI